MCQTFILGIQMEQYLETKKLVSDVHRCLYRFEIKYAQNHTI